MKIVKLQAAVAAVALMAGFPALAQDAAEEEVETDWYVYAADDGSECFAISSPTGASYFREGEEVSANTDPPYLTVVYRPAEGAEGQVAYHGGFPFGDEPIEVTVGGEEHELFTEETWAWPANPEADAELISSMRDADEIELSSFSSRDTNVVHTFSLEGFPAAVDEAERRCSGD
ncbi:invasion associated locus B family protein [Histidinibacterium aquaticum]|uniref:hypothetical protein n=1 Tax=Histidinibacterium aquaticum TaxID=2613962 RepID=UPI00168B1E92|nr:hypothetical protein [Histidinibacterium aquaticum]